MAASPPGAATSSALRRAREFLAAGEAQLLNNGAGELLADDLRALPERAG